MLISIGKGKGLTQNDISAINGSDLLRSLALMQPPCSSASYCLTDQTNFSPALHTRPLSDY